MERRTISVLVANRIVEILGSGGKPSTNRLLIASISEEEKTAAGIIIPNSVDNEVSKRGVIIQQGHISSEYEEYRDSLNPGVIVYYGDYAGKDLTDMLDGCNMGDLKLPAGLKLRVLDINEVIYLRNNK